MRFKNSLINFIVSWSGHIVYTLVTFISRSFFIKILGSEYLGVSSLFSNILSMLSLAELGLTTAISFSLYDPLEKKDIEKIKSLIAIFRKTYFLIGGFILLSGLLLMPFLQNFIAEIPSSIFTINDLRVFFILYVINIACNYFYSARSVLISADQKNYIINLNYYIWNILCQIIQIIFLFYTKNYLVYLIIQIIVTIIQNIIINRISIKLYPYLKETSKKLETKDLRKLSKYIYATVFHKIGGIFVNSTDNLIISKYLGLLTVGVVSNYIMIISTINTFMGKFFTSISASIGNYSVSNNKKQTYRLFQNIYFIGFWIYSFAFVCLFCLLDPFITIWLGNNYLINTEIVMVLCLNFYINGMRQIILTFRDSMGLFWNDRYKPIFEGIFNLIISILLVKYTGLIGVYIGTLLTYIIIDLPIEPTILIKKGLNSSLISFYKTYILYFSITMLSCFACKAFIQILNQVFSGILLFVLQCISVAILHNVIVFLLFIKTDSMSFIKTKFISFIKGASNEE